MYLIITDEFEIFKTKTIDKEYLQAAEDMIYTVFDISNVSNPKYYTKNGWVAIKYG